MKLIFPVIDAAGTGANILALRRQRGLSVREVQEWFGFDSPRAIYKWQKGQTLPSVDNLYALSVLLGVSMEQILMPQKRQMGTTEEKTQLQERIAAAFFCWCCRFCEILSVNPGLYDKIMIGVAERQILLFASWLQYYCNGNTPFKAEKKHRAGAGCFTASLFRTAQSHAL